MLRRFRETPTLRAYHLQPLIPRIANDRAVIVGNQPV
jgi:hypothetical protein